MMWYALWPGVVVCLGGAGSAGELLHIIRHEVQPLLQC